jgi:sugar lactone lactonase YvrE
MGRAEVECVADGFAFCEAPRWHRGRLYFSDFYAHRVHALAPGGGLTTICEVPGQPSGLGFMPDGRLLVVSMTDRRVLAWDRDGLRDHADLGALAPYHLNDMLVDPAGRAYVGNFGSDVDTEDVRPTPLIRVDPDGSTRVAAEGLVFPNGMVLAPDGRTLLVAESFAYRISAFDVGAGGTLSNRREWARFGDGAARTHDDFMTTDAVLPDGICLDEEGALWVSHARGDGIARMAPGGDVLDVVGTGDLAVYAAVLGGDDRRTLYLCAGPPLGAVDPTRTRAGCILACRVAVPGAGLP